MRSHSRVNKILRYFGRYHKKTCSPISGRIYTTYEFALIMKLIRDWVNDHNQEGGSYVGVMERGPLTGKLHYHGIVWKTQHNKPSPLSKLEMEELRKIIHSRIEIFRGLEVKKGAAQAKRLTLLRQKYPVDEADLKGVGNPFYLVQLKKKGIPLNWSSAAARYMFKSMVEESHLDEFATSSGVALTLRHINLMLAVQTEIDQGPVLNGHAGSFNLKLVSLLVNAVVADLNSGLEFHTIAHRWFWNRVLIRYDGLKLKKNKLALLAIAILYVILKAQKPLNRMDFEPHGTGENFTLLLSNCRRVLGRCGRWWATHHLDTLEELVAQVETERQRLNDLKTKRTRND